MVNEIYHYFYHHVFFLRSALRNHQGESDQCIVCNALGAIHAIQNTVIVHKPKEQRCGNALIAVAERVVFRYSRH